MNRRFLARPVDIPKAPKTYSLSLTRPDGGLNLYDSETQLAANQSPDMENLYWHDGALRSRPGLAISTGISPYMPIGNGTAYAAYYTLDHRKLYAHVGEHLYKVERTFGSCSDLCSGIPAYPGTFFEFKGNTYYKTQGCFKKIDFGNVVEEDVEPYVPVTVVNLHPNGTGGDLYQPENRIGSAKEVWYNADGTSTAYKLPYTGSDVTVLSVSVYGVELESTDYSFDVDTSTVTFNTAPESSDTLQNGVKIVCDKPNSIAYAPVMNAQTAIAYGVGTDATVVLATGGRYFWSAVGVTDEPNYFPMDYYNSVDEEITAFSKQQNMLIIFTKNTTGKATYKLETIDSREYLAMNYSVINSSKGCDLPKSIQTIGNNLVFAHSAYGVLMLTDTSSAGENNIVEISRNINGSKTKPGLLKDLAFDPYPAAEHVSSTDDGERYWLTVDGHCYVWDYRLSPYQGSPARLSWFYFTGFSRPVAWGYFGETFGTAIHFAFVDENGNERVISNEAFEDTVYDSVAYENITTPIRKRYQTPVLNFSTYEQLKDVVKVIFSMPPRVQSYASITYLTDYEEREDATPMCRTWVSPDAVSSDVGYDGRWVLLDLENRDLRNSRFSPVEVRKPGCIHIQHFAIRLDSNEAGADMPVSEIQIFYKFAGGDR